MTGKRRIKMQRMRIQVAIALTLLLIISFKEMNGQTSMNNNQTLNAKEQSVVTISAFTATGDLELLRKTLNKGLDAGLTVNEIKEVLVQMYALLRLSAQSEWHQYFYVSAGRAEEERH